MNGGIFTMDFSIRFKNLIEENGLAQKQIAIDLHIADSTISGYLSEYRQPDFEMLIRIARYFDVTTDYLLGLSEDKKPAPSDLDATESELIYLFRSLIAERKRLFMGQTRLFKSLSEKP